MRDTIGRAQDNDIQMQIKSEKEYLKAKLKLAKLKAQEAAYIEANRIEYFRPFPHQERAFEFVHGGKKTVLLQGGNQIGKTCWAVNLIGSFMLGFQPWDKRETIFGKKPVIGRILCNDWEKAARDTIVPKLKEWLPAGSYETKKNNVGVEHEWYFPKTRSKFTILTYKEDTKSHEGWTGHFVHCDEPPPKDKYTANRRGLVANNGIMTIAMTALDEPWILDDIVLKPDPSIGIVADIPITANPTLTAEAIRIFERDLPESERVARIQGGWLQLVGRIWKDFDKEKHVVRTYKIPPDWPVTFQIDFHVSTPHMVCFFAVNPQGQRFQIEEIWRNCNSEELADDIIRLKQINAWRMKHGEIDALSKGDSAYVKNRLGMVEDSFTVISKRLQKFGIRLGVGSKDEKSYIKSVEGWLRGANNGLPTFFIMDNCPESIKQVDRWTYDDNGKPKDDGHAPECIGRFSQMGLKYTDPAEWDKPLEYAPVTA